MVLLAAAISTKGGKIIVSRQFVEMTKARIEGLLSAFPKLMSTGKQHTFVETDSVRYVYQPLDKLYMLLITTKASNILEDLETLRLFSRVIPEYCATMDEMEILNNAFNLIFAFDEIVALGYRESVNLAQIRTFVEMDSHEERVFQAVRQTQEREAKNKMREKAKELQRQRMENNKRGIKSSSAGGGMGGMGGFGSGMGNNNFSGRNPPSGLVMDESHGSGLSNDTPRAKSILKQPAAAKAMKLGSKARDVESFVDQLKSEGENVISPVAATTAPANSIKQKFAAVTLEHVEDVYVRLEERLVVEFGNESGLKNLEVHGLVTLRISDEKLGRIRIGFDNPENRNIQIQTHPNVDKELFKAKSQVGLKNAAKPFPIDTDVSILKWRLHSTEESLIPLTINCWPSDNGQGGCDVNIEYVLEHDHLELEDVVIIIPIPSGVNPVIVECDGEYTHDSRKNALTWRLSSVDKTNKSGALEFSCANSQTQDFFPVHVTFMSKCSYANFKVSEVRLIDDDSPVKFSSETIMYTERYDIV